MCCRVDLETELGGKAHHAQHAHRVFAETCVRIADHPHHAGLEVGDAAGVILDREIADVVIERVHRDVAPHRVLVLGTEHVVGQQPAGRVHIVVGFAVFFTGVRRPLLRILRARHWYIPVRRGTEGGHLDDVLSVTHVRQAEAPADQTRVAEQFLDLLRAGVGDDVEILGLAPQHEIAHTTAHEKTRVAGIFQAIQNF